MGVTKNLIAPNRRQMMNKTHQSLAKEGAQRPTAGLPGND